MSDDDQAMLARVASQIVGRNAVGAEIAGIVGRPALLGHVGEWIAAVIFSIRLHQSASTPTSDGLFTAGPLTGKSVNVN